MNSTTATRAKLLVAISAACVVLFAQAQHTHLNAGALSQDAGAQLFWVNGNAFSTNAGYVQELPLSTSGTYSNYFNSGPTMTALPTSVANGGPAAFAALQG